MKKIINCSILFFVLAGCVTLKTSEFRLYQNVNFGKSYKKYLLKDGYVKYRIIKRYNLDIDTIYCDVFFDNFGATEYIKCSYSSSSNEVLKIDSIQYKKTKTIFFDSISSRKNEFPFENLIINKTSQLYANLFCGKPLNVKYQKRTCHSCLTAFHKESSNIRYTTTYYKGLPVYCEHYKIDSSWYGLSTVRIDTAIKFPLVLEIK